MILRTPGTLLFSLSVMLIFSGKGTAEPIDRHVLVTRHNIDWPSVAGEIPLGNGNFAFNADGTGLETVGGNTMSHWCWHRFPLPAGVTKDDIKPWATPDHGHLEGMTTKEPDAIYKWERANPQPLNLGRIGFIDSSGERLKATDIHVDQRHLDLWTGLLRSQFTYQGESVAVETCVDPKSDTVAVKVKSPLLREGKLNILLDFPAPAHLKGSWVGDFSKTTGHKTIVLDSSADRTDLSREIDDTKYQVAVDGAVVHPAKAATGPAEHQYIISSQSDADSIAFTCHFGLTAATDKNSNVADAQAACAAYWPTFWNSGGAIDLSLSKDPRWMELERRIVLSQYELAVQSAGDNPPAEVGLTGFDPWEAKWHFEMIWWHLAHYALWDRWPMADKALSIYQRVAPVAESIAKNFDYKGMMWPKSTGPDGYNDGYPYEMPLMWRIPHPIFFAELDYRAHPTPATLAKWKDIVFGTAEFMASYPTKDSSGQYNLDPVWPATEGRGMKRNTVYELGYWRVAMEMAQHWRVRLGEPREPHWDEVIAHLAPLPIKDGLYVYDAEHSDTYTKRRFDHIDTVSDFAMLPAFAGLNQSIAHNTLIEISKGWQWDGCWGWDFPMVAMAAARVGEPKIAVDTLFITSKKNEYDERGLNVRGSEPYLPANGGLLYAAAMMAAGWDNAPKRNAPGFPDDGSWTVRWEGLKVAP